MRDITLVSMQVRSGSRHTPSQVTKKSPSESQSQLFMPDLNAESEPIEEPKVSIWTSKLMMVVYISTAGSYLFHNCYFLLYGILMFLLVAIGLILLKWIHFFGHDPYVQSAVKGWGKHHKIAMKELGRTTNGGFIRRRQEVIMAGLGYQSTFHLQNYFEQQSREINVRARDDYTTRIAQYKDRKSSRA